MPIIYGKKTTVKKMSLKWKPLYTQYASFCVSQNACRAALSKKLKNTRYVFVKTKSQKTYGTGTNKKMDFEVFVKRRQK